MTNKSDYSEIHFLIGANIRRIRCQRNVSQRDLAAWCDFESSNLSRIESGRTNITISNLIKIANALRVDVKELLEGI